MAYLPGKTMLSFLKGNKADITRNGAKVEILTNVCIATPMYIINASQPFNAVFSQTFIGKV
jgi:hypothetical protein